MADGHGTRACKKCGCAEFTKEGKCKACVSARRRARYAANPEKELASNAAYRADNRDAVLQQKRAHWDANKAAINRRRSEANAVNPEPSRAAARARRLRLGDQIRAQQAASYRRNKEKANARHRAWYAANRESALQQMQRYAEAHPEVRRRARENWTRRNPEAVRQKGRERRLRQKLGGGLSNGLMRRLYALQRGKCPCCAKPLGDKYHLDHVVPLALGGEHADHNMQLLRNTCNLQKSKKHPVDFMRSRGFLL